MTRKAIILLSGGLDSTVCLALAKSQQLACYTLSFDYGQKNKIELTRAFEISNLYQAEKHQVFRMSLEGFGGSYLTDDTRPVPAYCAHEPQKSSPYVPGRNSLFLSAAFSYAEVVQADEIILGLTLSGEPGFPDATQKYLDAFQIMANIATERNAQTQITISTPLMTLTKAEIIKLGYSLQVDFSRTITCYQPSPKGEACGTCLSCALRKEGFEEAGIGDPTSYYAKAE